MRSRGNRSMPAGTGVWVVKTVDARTCARASSNVEAVLRDELRHPLEALEPGVPLVRVVDVGRGLPVSALHARTARTPPTPSSSSCSRRCSPPPPYRRSVTRRMLLGVRRRLGVEQQQRDAADVGDPDARVQLAVAGQVERDLDGRAVRVAQQREAEAVRVEQRVALALPAVVADRLAEVAGAVEEADAGERHAEVGRALEVIAREDAETARVLGERAVDAELGGEVGDVGGLVALEVLEPAVARRGRR